MVVPKEAPKVELPEQGKVATPTGPLGILEIAEGCRDPVVGKTVDAKTLRDLLRREEEDAAARRVSILAAPSPPAPHHRIVEKEVRVEVPPPPEAPPSAPPRAAARMPRRHGRNSPAVAVVARCPWR